MTPHNLFESTKSKKITISDKKSNQMQFAKAAGNTQPVQTKKYLVDSSKPIATSARSKNVGVKPKKLASKQPAHMKPMQASKKSPTPRGTSTPGSALPRRVV